MSENNLPEFISFFTTPGNYHYDVDKVKLVQTHISYVLLAGKYVYKIKKPVDFGFLNFTTLDKRKYYCEQELMLNKRLCPSLYLDTVAITRTDSGFEFNGTGEIIDYAVRMSRMNEEKMMGNLLQDNKLSTETLDKLVDILVPFYEKADDSDEILEFGKAESVAVNVLENFEQTESFIGSEALSREQFNKIRSYAKNFLKQENLFNKRIQDGRIKDCHGDLYSANICIDTKIYIYDCIEFNQRFRYCDVASDVAFLAMDLDFHDLSDLSSHFIKKFSDQSKDKDLEKMLDFYKCYRAYVRGKIGLFTASSPEVDQQTKDTCLAQAKKYFILAENYSE
jgi:uncharacterized protein